MERSLLRVHTNPIFLRLTIVSVRPLQAVFLCFAVANVISELLRAGCGNKFALAYSPRKRWQRSTIQACINVRISLAYCYQIIFAVLSSICPGTYSICSACKESVSLLLKRKDCVKHKEIENGGGFAARSTRDSFSGGSWTRDREALTEETALKFCSHLEKTAL